MRRPFIHSSRNPPVLGGLAMGGFAAAVLVFC